MDPTIPLVSAVVGFVAGALVAEFRFRRLFSRLRELKSEVSLIRAEWERAWSLIDSAAKRAMRYSKAAERPEGNLTVVTREDVLNRARMARRGA